MTNRKSDDVALAWIALHRVADDAEKERVYWAFEHLQKLVQSHPEEAFHLILQIIQRDGSNEILSNVGAGPIEDLLCSHGAQFVDRLEVYARDDERVRKALGAVWQNKIPEPIWRRIRAVVGEGC